MVSPSVPVGTGVPSGKVAVVVAEGLVIVSPSVAVGSGVSVVSDGIPPSYVEMSDPSSSVAPEVTVIVLPLSSVGTGAPSGYVASLVVCSGTPPS